MPCGDGCDPGGFNQTLGLDLGIIGAVIASLLLIWLLRRTARWLPTRLRPYPLLAILLVLVAATMTIVLIHWRVVILTDGTEYQCGTAESAATAEPLDGALPDWAQACKTAGQVKMRDAQTIGVPLWAVSGVVGLAVVVCGRRARAAQVGTQTHQVGERLTE